MISRDSIETTYSFLHQKAQVYVHSTLEWQRDDIEVSIADFVDQISPELLQLLSGGRHDFLKDHRHFALDMAQAVATLEQMLAGKG